MKILIVLILLIPITLLSQNVGINEAGVLPHNSAGLDIDYTNKGFLVPRVIDTTAVFNPSVGLEIFDLSSNCIRYRVDTKWTKCLNKSNSSSSNGTVNFPGMLGFIEGQNIVCNSSSAVYSIDPIQGITNYSWSVPAGSTITSGQGTTSVTVTFGSNSGSISVSGTNSSGTFPISAKNVTVNVTSTVMLMPPANIGISSFNAFWVPVDNALTYYLDVSTDSTFATFVSGYNNLNVGNNSNYLVSGLSIGTLYYYRVRVTDNCGTSMNAGFQSTYTKLMGCDPSQKENAYSTATGILGVPSLIWITRNLGATSQASSAFDVSMASAGCYFQFNRLKPYAVNGDENGLTTNPSWVVISISEVNNWEFQNDPCRAQLGGSWRLPTASEWNSADVANNWSVVSLFSSVLKVHVAGYVNNNALILRGSTGALWSSTSFSNTNGSSYSSATMANVSKNWALSVRCVK